LYLNAIAFERLIRNTPNIIVMDAFLNQHHIEVIKQFRPNAEFSKTHYVHPYPVIRKCYKLVRNKKEEKGEENKSNHQAIISTILFMAKEGKRIYVPSYSKEFVKDLCYVFELNGMKDNIQDYTSDTDDNVKRWDASNANILEEISNSVCNWNSRRGNRFFGKALQCNFCYYWLLKHCRITIPVIT